MTSQNIGKFHRTVVCKESSFVSRVDCVAVPSTIGRILRKISSAFGGFTAEQWLNWTVVYFLYALRALIGKEHYEWWCYSVHNDSRYGRHSNILACWAGDTGDIETKSDLRLE